MMKRPAGACLLGLLLALHGGVHALTPAERAYLGGYTQSSTDAQSQLMLLDDNTFCFRFMGGSLDMMVAGRWKALPGKEAGVQIQEVRLPQKTNFPAFSKPAAGKDVVFDFHGYTLGEANAPVFGVSTTVEPPRMLRPLFGDDNHSWAESYKLPPLARAAARYFYIGQVEMDARGKPLQLRVTQYQLPADQGLVRIGFNTQQARPPLNLVAQIKDSVLKVGGQPFGSRDVLSQELVDEIRNVCVSPVLLPGKPRARPADPEDEDEPADGPPPLDPLKTLVLPLNVVQGEAYFHPKGY
jgi:hypothetical protein